MELKDLIKTRRLEIGKTLEQIGNEVGVAKATVQRWESGEIKDMRRDKLLALSKALNTSPGYLMGWETATGDPIEKKRNELTDEISSLFSALSPALQEQALSYLRFLIDQQGN